MDGPKFFGCFDLRRGSIVFAWLQMMLVVIVIGVLAGFLDISNSIADRDDTNISSEKPNHVYFSLIVKIEIAAYVIKGVTLIALTWGLAKKKYMFYQPWLFISLIELGIQILLACFYFVMLFKNTILFEDFATIGLGAALNGYIIYCVYNVYVKDKRNNPTSVRFDEEYNAVTNEPNCVFKQ